MKLTASSRLPAVLKAKELARVMARSKSRSAAGYSTWDQQGQIDKMAAIQRDVLDGALVDGLTNGHRSRLDHRAAASTVTTSLVLATFTLKFWTEFLLTSRIKFLPAVSRTIHPHFDVVRSRRQCGHFIRPVALVWVVRSIPEDVSFTVTLHDYSGSALIGDGP